MELIYLENLTTIVKALDAKHAEDIVVLDMQQFSPIYDYMVITTDLEAETGLELKRIEGAHAAQWILADFGRVIVHVFTPETRLEYNLEKLWRDVPRLDVEGMLA